MQPVEPLESDSPSAPGPDPAAVGRAAAFAVAAGAVVAALVATVGATSGADRRFTLLALLALPAASFVFATLELDSRLRLSGSLDPTPGVVEAWGVVLVAAAGGTVAYGPALGAGSGPVNASLVLLALFSYLVGPPWFAWRLLDGPLAPDVAVVSVLLSLLSVLAGGGLLALGAAGAPGGIPTLGAAGAMGVLALGYSAGGSGAGTDGDSGDTDEASDADAGDQDGTHPEIDAAAARRSNRT